ncbi:MAG: hypothetical protein MZV63_51920 [Marinilabiliales bacterium]|nr:hypothetical protein [Marinilabiliales bacterium]
MIRWYGGYFFDLPRPCRPRLRRSLHRDKDQYGMMIDSFEEICRRADTAKRPGN